MIFSYLLLASFSALLSYEVARSLSPQTVALKENYYKVAEAVEQENYRAVEQENYRVVEENYKVVERDSCKAVEAD